MYNQHIIKRLILVLYLFMLSYFFYIWSKLMAFIDLIHFSLFHTSFILSFYIQSQEHLICFTRFLSVHFAYNMLFMYQILQNHLSLFNRCNQLLFVASIYVKRFPALAKVFLTYTDMSLQAFSSAVTRLCRINCRKVDHLLPRSSAHCFLAWYVAIYFIVRSFSGRSHQLFLHSCIFPLRLCSNICISMHALFWSIQNTTKTAGYDFYLQEWILIFRIFNRSNFFLLSLTIFSKYPLILFWSQPSTHCHQRVWGYWGYVR